MWLIALEHTQKAAEGTEHLKGDKEACESWLKDNQLFWTEENPNPTNGEVSGSKYVLVDLEEEIETVVDGENPPVEPAE